MTMPILSYLDNANGTGGTLTLTGGDAVTYIVQATLADRETWADLPETRAGSGTISLPISRFAPTRFYFLRVRSGSSYSDKVLAWATLGYSSVTHKAIVGTCLQLFDLSLPGIGTKILACEHPRVLLGTNATWPCAVVYPDTPEQRDESKSNNQQTRWTASVTIGLADRDSNYVDGLELHLYQRKLIWATFDRSDKIVSGIRCKVRPGTPIPPEAPEYQFFYTTMGLEFEFTKAIGA